METLSQRINWSETRFGVEKIRKSKFVDVSNFGRILANERSWLWGEVRV